MKFQLTEEQIEKLDQALVAPVGRDAAIKRAWEGFGRELGFNPATVADTVRGENFVEFEAKPLAHTKPEASPPMDEAPEDPEPKQAEETAPATLVSAGEASEGVAKAAGDLVKAENPEVVELVKAAKESAISMDSAFELVQRFVPLTQEARALLVTAKTINVTAEDQKAAMAMARTVRLGLRDIRLRSERLRKGLKEDSVKRGRAIDGLHKVVDYMISAEELRLEEQEKFAERAAAEREQKLALDRYNQLANVGFTAGCEALPTLGSMPQVDFDRLLEGQRLAKEAAEKRERDAKAEAERKAEEDRKAREAEAERKRQEQEERERKAEEEKKRVEEQLRLAKLGRDRMVALSRCGVTLEAIAGRSPAIRINMAGGLHISSSMALEQLPEADYLEILKQSSENFDAEQRKVKAQREEQERRQKEADDKAAAEKKRADDAQAELNRQKKAKEDAERKRKQDEARAARAPDKKKLEAYAQQIAAVTVPVMTTEAGEFALQVITEQFKEAHRFAMETIKELE